MKEKRAPKNTIALLLVLLLLGNALLFIQNTSIIANGDDSISVSFDPNPGLPSDLPVTTIPPNGATNINIPVILGVDLKNYTNDTINVYFFDASNDNLIGVDYNVTPNVSMALTAWNNLSEGTTYTWFIVIESGATSQTWSFTTIYPSTPGPPVSFNAPPRANAGGPYSGYIGQTIIFDATASYDLDGTILGYQWDFTTDGIYDTDWLEEALTTNSYATAGTHTVTLQVRDNKGATNTDTATVTINVLRDRYSPTAIINVSSAGFVTHSVTFSGSESSDVDGTIVDYQWNFGDGNTGNGATVDHVYTAAGKYVVTLRITDNDGLYNADIALITILAILEDIEINTVTHYLVDSTGDGQINAFYNTTSALITPVELTENNQLLIDDNDDDVWDYVYDPVKKTLTPYEEKGVLAFELRIALIIVFIVIILLIIILLERYRKKQSSE